MTLLVEIATYLEEKRHGARRFSIFEGRMPDSQAVGPLPPDVPDPCICVYETAGDSSLRSFCGPYAERPRFQVVVRSADYEVARALAERIKGDLDGILEQVIAGHHYSEIIALQPPFALSPDGRERERIATNYQATRAAA